MRALASQHRGLLVALAVVALAALAVMLRYRAPQPLGLDAPSDRFAAARAQEQLALLLDGIGPHPRGSEANARVRGRLLERLYALELAPQVQRAEGCGRTRGRPCAEVHNVIATIPGARPEAILLVVHYDSVPAGPGASDDGVGVAALLEVARALKRQAPLPRTVVLLFDDGEEQGLLGAEAFVAEHPLAREARAVVNLEARGTSGPSLLFETSRGNALLARLFSDALERPFTSSLFAAVYRRLPNDTDFTVFQRHGIAGVNLAFIEDVQHYHTPRDDLAHVSPASLQHHGDNALALARAFVRHEGDFTAASDAVWFDVLGWGVVRWPIDWTLPLAGVVVGVPLLVLVRRTLRRKAGGLAACFGALLLVPAGAVAGAWLFMALNRVAHGHPAPWWAHPLPSMAALWSAAALALALSVALASRRHAFSSSWLALTLYWSVLAFAVGKLLPEGSYLFVLPASALAIVGLLAHVDEIEPRGTLALLLAALPFGVTAIVWLPTILGLEKAVTLAAHPVVAAAAALALTPALPLVRQVERRWTASLLAGAALLASIVTALVVPVYSDAYPPRPDALEYRLGP